MTHQVNARYAFGQVFNQQSFVFVPLCVPVPAERTVTHDVGDEEGDPMRHVVALAHPLSKPEPGSGMLSATSLVKYDKCERKCGSSPWTADGVRPALFTRLRKPWTL